MLSAAPPPPPTAAAAAAAGGQADAPVPSTDLPNLSFLLNDPIARRLSVGDTSAGPAHTPLTTHTTFILSQLPALRALLEQLRPKLASLSKQPEEPSEHDAKRRERQEYIDSRVKVHLERTGELGGSAGEGHGVVKGRRIDSKEVNALESVVGMFE
jgi:kinetochore protein Mis12/MTW1